jgi:hypothetical protein
MAVQLPDPAMTVDELIVALQQMSKDGQGQAAVHVLMEGDTTGPVRSAQLLPSFGDWHHMTALLETDRDDEAAGRVFRTQGSSMTGERALHTELAGLCAAAAHLHKAGQTDCEAAVRAAIARFTRDYAEQLSGPVEPYTE